MNLKKINLSLIIVMSLLLAGLTACQKDQPEVQAETVTPVKAAAGSNVADMLASMSLYHFAETVEAPEFELESVDGKTVSLSQYKGSVVFLSFWTTW